MDMERLIKYSREYLDIKKPIRIEIKNRIYKNSAGVHWVDRLDNGKIKCHIIKVSLNQISEDRNMNTVIAHEFVHAWQAEHKPFKKIAHNNTFQNKAKDFQRYLHRIGFDIQPLYRKGVDVV